MSPVTRMHHSIDVSRYYRLPPDVRARFDFWLEQTGLRDKKVVELRLAEGYVVIDRYAVDDDGKYVLDADGKALVVETETVPVKVPPPREVFEIPSAVMQEVVE